MLARFLYSCLQIKSYQFGLQMKELFEAGTTNLVKLSKLFQFSQNTKTKQYPSKSNDIKNPTEPITASIINKIKLTLYDGGPYQIETSPLMDWFLFDRVLRHERVKKNYSY